MKVENLDASGFLIILFVELLLYFAFTLGHMITLFEPVMLFILGFYDTSNETFEPNQPNFKRLRQQELDGELRRDKEAVSYFRVNHLCE